jgi:amidase
MSKPSPNAKWNAFLPDQEFSLRSNMSGPLTGLTVSVKDLFDISGRPTGAGNPEWLNSHPIPTKNAVVVQKLLDAGCEIVGKTITEELAYSLVGENTHYGTPVNPHNPDCIPGGSSSGCASSTAAKLCDIGLGSDTAGSIRLPASFCGIWGFRPSHGLLSSEGVVPLSPSFDTPGWMTRDADSLRLVGKTLLPIQSQAQTSSNISNKKILFPKDVWELCSYEINQTLSPIQRKLEALFAGTSSINLSSNGLVEWQNDFRFFQGYEAWQYHGKWIESHQPNFGAPIHDRFNWASSISKEQANTAQEKLQTYRSIIRDLLNEYMICMPTVSYLAPQKGKASSDQDRTNALCLLAISSLSGVPQVTMPLSTLNGKALGISLLGAYGSDQAILDWICETNISK